MADDQLAALWALNLDGSIDPNLNVNHFMLFGALISSTDPIATLGILKSAGANPLLYDLIFGESALNDCIAIVVFHIFHDRPGQRFPIDKARDILGFRPQYNADHLWRRGGMSSRAQADD